MLDPSTDIQNIYSVSEITQEIKELLEYNLPVVWVQGELSNFVHHSSGHMYFSLKDKDAQISAVMWKSRNRALPFTPQNGMKLNAHGAVRVYERRGNYQLDVVKMMPVGIGDLQLMFEALKEQLFKEGLFDDEYKKPLPEFPERIGLVTSLTGAALQDILHVLNRRFPSAQKILRPTLVQGQGAAQDIADAIQEFNDYGDVDIVIVGRGGGSLEDLWAFNEEVVARSIFASAIPIVSAVGHEVDYTISDFVADLRAPTPSAAAELIAPDHIDLLNTIRTLKNRSAVAVSYQLDSQRERIDRLQHRYAFRRPLDTTLQYRQKVDDLFHSIQLNAQRTVAAYREKISILDSRIKSAHPNSLLRRGYAIVQKGKDGDIIRTAAQLEPDDELNVYLGAGSFISTVKKIDENGALDKIKAEWKSHEK